MAGFKLINTRTLGGANRFLAFVLVKVVNCRSEFPEMVKGHQAHKVQLCQTYSIVYVGLASNSWTFLTNNVLCQIVTIYLLHDLASQYKHYQMQPLHFSDI